MTIDSSTVSGDPLFFSITPPLRIFREDQRDKSSLETKGFFDRRMQEEVSPIDELISNAFAINKLYFAYAEDRTAPLPAELGSLIVLGYMSASESYFRSVFRRLINIDARCQHAQFDKQLRFAAALHHDADMLPEALLESRVFSYSNAVLQIWKDLAGVSKVPDDLEKRAVEYQKVCEIRHCCVHRFGRLGVSNATKMGLMEHKDFLEGNFSPSIEDIEEIADFLINFIKSFNSSLFQHVLVATAKKQMDPSSDNPYEWIWTWNYNQDRRRFNSYYKTFAIQSFKPTSVDARALYDSFRKAHRPRR